jgi:hypothetical protein
MTRETAPLPMLRAGLDSDWAQLTSLGVFRCTQVRMWYLRAMWPIQPLPCSALAT